MGDGDLLDEELRHRRTSKGEQRWPPALAVVVAAVAYALLPESLLFAPRLVIPGIEVLLLVATLVVDPVRLTRETRWSRAASTALAAVMVLANLVALGMLVVATTRSSTGAGDLLVAAMQVWLTNVVGFALVFWQLDRGGPVARREVRRDRLPPADWRFSQDEDDDAVVEVAVASSVKSGWVPVFVDYLYMSVTNSSAFSPTDTMPLTSRAKLLMAVEATAALLTTLLLVARAVGSLGGGG